MEHSERVRTRHATIGSELTSAPGRLSSHTPGLLVCHATFEIVIFFELDSDAIVMVIEVV